MPPRKANIGRNAKQRRPPLQKVIVFCEGRNTEPSYLMQFNRHFGSGLLDVIPIGGSGAPKTITARAIEAQLRISQSADSFERNDEVWVCFDRDDHDLVSQCLYRCRKKGIGVAFSNPCIELWAVIHFQEHVSDAPLDRFKIQKILKTNMPKYDSKSKIFDFELLSLHYERAIKNASILVKRRTDAGEPDDAPVTTFHLLTERIKRNKRNPR